jgi:hypothetical protein
MRLCRLLLLMLVALVSPSGIASAAVAMETGDTPPLSIDPSRTSADEGQPGDIYIHAPPDMRSYDSAPFQIIVTPEIPWGPYNKNIPTQKFRHGQSGAEPSINRTKKR